MILKPEQVYERIQDNSGVYVVYIFYYLLLDQSVFYLDCSKMKTNYFIPMYDYSRGELDENSDSDISVNFSTVVFSPFPETVRDKNCVGFKKRNEAEYFLKLIDRYMRPLYTESDSFLDELESQSVINRLENKMIEYCNRNR